jgi:DNA invertase Pin-like site-specific DNA recombinase
MGKVFAYARVSTPRQGEKGVSLVEQRDAITRYADRHGLEITRWFEEQESAFKKGRPEFNQMLRLLRLGVAKGVVIHKIDRSARNLEDWNDIGKLVDAGVDVHFATESIDLKTTAGRLSADIQAVVATHYSRNLREEVKKGLYGRLKQGFYPWAAPVGYLDHGSAKSKTPDPIRAPMITATFELYSTGEYSLPRLAKEMFGRGLRNRHGGAISVNGLATILRNPFYVGLMRILKTGDSYRGSQEPLVSTTVFEAVQLVLSGKRVDRVLTHIFLFSRTARCATCGYSLIGERQKGHVYYRCHDRPFKNPSVCPTTSVREEEIDDVLNGVLGKIELSDAELAIAKEMLVERRMQLAQQQVSAKSALKLQVDQLENRISRLTDLLLEGTIERPLFERKQRDLLLERAAVEEKLTEAHDSSTEGLAQLEKTVELARHASLLYKTASLENKRKLLKILLSNLTVCGKNVEITLSIPFRMIAEREKNDSCRLDRGTCRTWEHIIQELLRYSSEIRPKV